MAMSEGEALGVVMLHVFCSGRFGIVPPELRKTFFDKPMNLYSSFQNG